MALVSLTNIINGNVATHTELNANFAALKTQIDDNLDGENWSRLAELTVVTGVVTSMICDEIDVTELMTIKLPSNDGSNTLIFKDFQGNTVMTIASDGEVTI